MPDKTLTINHAGGGSETYTINRDKFEGIRNMTVDGATVSVDHTPADNLRNLLVDAENVTIDRAQGGEIRTLFIDGVEVTIDRTGEVIVEGFLTLFPNAAAAYSLQRLNGHQALINARRGSDNVEVDVYPDSSANREVSASSPITVTSGSSTATTFGEFLTEGGSHNAFVTTWYDQAGSNDASQSLDDAQPKIAEAGSLIVDANGNPWIDFQNSAGGAIGLDLASNIRETNGASSIFASIKFDGIFTGTTTYQNPLSLYKTQRWMVGSVQGPVGYKDIVLSDASGTVTDFRYVRFPCTLTNHNILSSIYDGSSTTSGGKPDIQFDENSVSRVGTDGSSHFGIPTTGNNSIGYNTQSSSQGCNAKIQEIIIYDSDQSANRDAIEANINGRYSIY